MENTKFCQSCGMPLTEDALCGTEADGEKSAEYCTYCYQNGAFTQDCTREEMIEFCAPIEVEQGRAQTLEEARRNLGRWFATLKRWQQA